VYAVLTLSGSKYPGETEVDDQANDMCNEQARLDAQGRRRVPDRRLSRETGGK
jgi:hypothetical protein